MQCNQLISLTRPQATALGSSFDKIVRYESSAMTCFKTCELRIRFLLKQMGHFDRRAIRNVGFTVSISLVKYDSMTDKGVAQHTWPKNKPLKHSVKKKKNDTH